MKEKLHELIDTIDDERLLIYFYNFMYSKLNVVS